MSQTSVQNKQTIRYGSAQVLIGSRFDQLIDIGAARSVALKETVTTVDVESDNAGVIASLVSEHKMEVTLDNLEINFKRYFEMRGGIDNLEEYDGKTEVKKESGTYKINELIQVPFVNADGSAVAIEKVYKKSSISNILLEEAFYEKVGENGIKITSANIKPNSDTLIIVYKQTPARMIRMGTGGKSSTIKPRCIQIVNTDANGKQLRIYLPQASIASGLEFSFPADKSQDVIVNKLSFSATTNSNQKAGEQLAWYEDEQAVYEEDNGIENAEEIEKPKENVEEVEDKKNTEENIPAPTVDGRQNNTEQDTKTETGENNQTETTKENPAENNGEQSSQENQTKEDNQAGSDQSSTDNGATDEQSPTEEGN